jgi:hypothetical protein
LGRTAIANVLGRKGLASRRNACRSGIRRQETVVRRQSSFVLSRGITDVTVAS